MFTQIDPNTPGYLWQACVRQIITAIATGRLAPGARLQSEPDLARQFGISRMTLRNGIEWLAGEGLVAKYRGRGTYVATQLPDPLPLPPDGRPLTDLPRPKHRRHGRPAPPPSS